MEETEKTLKEKIDTIHEAVQPKKKGDKKKIKIPSRAKVNRSKAKKGYVGILKVDENGNISGEKQRIEDSTFLLKSGDYHATDGQEILSWEGKYPVIIQPVKQVNPVVFNNCENKTYGQKYIMARMLKDAIKIKAKKGGFIIWIIVAAVLFIVGKQIFNF